MKRDALRGYRRPGYPRRGEEGNAVSDFIPKRWRRSGRVAGAMAFLLFPLPGGKARADVSPPHTAASPRADDHRKGPSGQTPLARVFAHGEGRGAFGCVAVAPPAFLTEHDARQVILEEFAKAGVHFQLDAKRLPELRERSVTVEYEKRADGKGYEAHQLEKRGEPMLLDGWDPAHQIGFEFISEGDYFKLGGVQSASTVQDYDFKEVAEKLAADAGRVSGMHLGIFYDPMAPAEWVHKSGEYHEAPNVRGEAELRAQVRDFIAWLKREGVL